MQEKGRDRDSDAPDQVRGNGYLPRMDRSDRGMGKGLLDPWNPCRRMGQSGFSRSIRL